MKHSKKLTLLSVLILSGCSSSSPTENPAYVSPVQYQGYTCKQVGMEMRRVSAKIDQKMQTDGTTQVLGAVVQAFAISKGYSTSGDDNDVELQRYKNQMDVLEQTSIQKNCN